MTGPDLTVIVISYNTRDLTLAALASLYAETQTPFDCIVVDNASADGSAAAIAAAFPQVRLIALTENIGFARANNLAAEGVQTGHMLLLNPDTEVQDHAVDRLLAFARRTPQAGIWGGRTVFRDGRLNIASCWRAMSLWSLLSAALGLRALFPRSALFNPEAYGGWPRDSVREVDIVVGCFLLIRRDLWQRLGGFDPRYYMYGEEADLCLRARRLGHRPMITPEAQIMHLVGAASGQVSDKTVLVTRARVALIRDHWPVWQQAPGVGLILLWAGLRRLATAPLALSPRPGHRDRAAHWARVWAGRHDWMRGYGHGG